MRALWLLALLPVLAQAYAPVTSELQEDFEAIGGAQCSSAGITLACTEKGAEAIWSTFADAGTTVTENTGSLRITSNGASTAYARVQTKVDYRNNFFVQPLKFTFTALDFIGAVANAPQEEFLFPLTSTQATHQATPDNLLLSVRGNGRIELSRKANSGATTSLFVSTPGWVATAATFVVDATSYRLVLTAPGLTAVHTGVHGLSVADWGARGDSAIGLSGRHVITTADGNTAIVVLGAFRVENLKFFDNFSNGDLEDAGVRPNFWTNTGTVAETGNTRTITGTGSSVGPLSKDFNFFGQQLKFRARLAHTWAGSTSAANKIRFALNSQAAGSGASHESFAVAFSPDAGGRMKAGWKTTDTTGVPEDVNVALNLTGLSPLPDVFELTLDRDDYAIAAFTSAGVAIDLNGATAGTTITGSHNINWIVWGPGNVPPQTANSAIVLENTGGFGSTVSTWNVVQVERLDPYWLKPTVYGPIADGMELEIAGDLDAVEHPLLASGFLDVTAEPFNADPLGGIDATNALNHAVNFATENHLNAYGNCGDEYLVSDRVIAWQPLQLRTTHDLADSPNNDEEGPPHFVGESNCVTPPELILADNAVGYNSATPKPVIQFWARNYNNYPDEVNDNLPGILFSGQIRGLDFDLTMDNDGAVTDAGNDGACAISMQGAQGTTIEEVNIDATGAFSGICGLPGGGGAMVDITVTGGATCIWGVAGPQGAAGSLMQPTITGLTCNGGTVRYDGLQTLILVGADLTVPNGTACITAGGGVGSGGVLLGYVSVIDSQCKFASASVNNDAIDTDSSFYLKNFYVQYAENIAVSPGGNLVSGQKLGWNHVIEAAKGINPGNYTPPTPDAQFLHTRYEDGVRILAGVDLFEEILDEAPPGDLQSQHLWTSWPAWETASVPAGLEADFTGDQTSDIQTSLSANAVTFLPRGIYAVSAGLDQEENDLVGASRVFTQIVTKKAVGSFDTDPPEPIITTTCDDASQAKLGFLKLHAQSQNIDLTTNPDVGGSYAVNWCAGDGIIRNIDLSRNSQFGYGNPTGTGGGSAEWQMVLFSANAGGKVYDLNYGEAFNHGPGWRHFKVDGTSNPLHFYHLNPEHAHGEANVEVVNSENVHIYGMKAEANHPVLWSRDSDNVNMYGYGGNGAAYDPHVAISGITKANPAVVTTAANTFATDNEITLHNVSGMTQVNNVRFTIVRINATSFSLRNLANTAAIDSTSYGTYVAGEDTASRLEEGFDLSRTPTLFRVENTPNFRLAALFDQVRLPSADHAVFGSGDNPGDWHMAYEVPPNTSTELLTLAFERPILMRRKTITVPPVLAVTVAGSLGVNNGQSYTAAAGTERAVVWVPSATLGSALIDFLSATYGAQAMTVRQEGRRTTGTVGRSVGIADVLEAPMPSGANALTGTWDVAPGTEKAHAITLDGVNQASPVRDSDIAECVTATSCTLPAMTAQIGDLVVAACQVAPDGTTITPAAGYSALTNSAAPLTAVMVKPVTANGTEAPSCTYSVAANSVMAGVVYAVSTGATGIVILRRRRE